MATGRPRNGVPYLKGGVYHIRFQGDKGTGTSLNTTSEREARRLGEALARKRGATMPSLVARSSPPSPSAPVDAPASQGSDSVSGALPSPSGDALTGWLSSESEFAGGSAFDPSSAAAPAPEGGVTLSPSEHSAITGLTSAERSRMHGLLSGIVGRANVLALGLGVRIFGRIPAEPEPADMELLNKAWQLQLDELLGDKEIKPYVMILAASAGLGIGMYAGGEPLPPKPKKGAEQAPLVSVP